MEVCGMACQHDRDILYKEVVNSTFFHMICSRYSDSFANNHSQPPGLMFTNSYQFLQLLVATPLLALRPSLLAYRPSLLDWKPSLLGWR